MKKVLSAALAIAATFMLVSCSAQTGVSVPNTPVGTISTPEPLPTAAEETSPELSIEGEGESAPPEEADESSPATDSEPSASQAQDEVTEEALSWQSIDFMSMGMDEPPEPEGAVLVSIEGSNGNFVDWTVKYSDVSLYSFKKFAQGLYDSGVGFCEQTWSKDGTSFDMKEADDLDDMLTVSEDGSSAKFYGFTWNGESLGTFKAALDAEQRTMSLTIWYVP